LSDLIIDSVRLHSFTHETDATMRHQLAARGVATGGMGIYTSDLIL